MPANGVDGNLDKTMLQDSMVDDYIYAMIRQEAEWQRTLA